MSRKLFTLTAVAAALALPTTASAYEIIGKQLEIYGQAHLSMDFVDNDTDSELALASNSSRLGFKGVTAINDQLNAIYQIESKIVFDEGGESFAGRNTFVGLGGDFGKVLFGNQDTPVRNVRGVFDLFGDTVADARNVADQANRRAKNSIQYITPEMGGLVFGGMYATDFADVENDEGLENNDFSLISGAVGYVAGGLELSVGYEKTDADVTEDETDAVRAAAGYDFGGFRVGAMYDRYEQDEADRDAWGLNGMFTFGKNALKVQYMTADDWSDMNDTGATQLSVGLDHSLAKNLKMYGIYSQLNNDDNTADYQIKGGHDTDVYQVVAAGDDISVFSLGMVYKF